MLRERLKQHLYSRTVERDVKTLISFRNVESYAIHNIVVMGVLPPMEPFPGWHSGACTGL